ncbi:hypothetical protein [Actinacidiphila acidipaludis]|uniref:Uncharacterized protein n=1 Tax=Actinacidiphila acidipaludis TaxID=2873382 RepID=A0ABS7QHI9_9ACTN|nr:hypothetical protein [Streptomyces acidipaludis]MBY8882423.1 hypothetical protein [Streptomyces acidipaludis]
MQVFEVTGYSVRSAVITMRHKDTPLRFLLFPMAHVAAPSFYRQVRERLEGCDLVVAEGVHGRSRQVEMLTLAYRLAARRERNGLVEQDYRTLLPPGVPVIAPDVSAGEAIADLKQATRWLYPVLLAAAPVAGAVFALRGPRAFLESESVDEHLPPAPGTGTPTPAGLDDPVDRALLDRRDLRLVDALSRIHTERADEPVTVAVVYGAEHIPAVVAGLLDRHGYRPRDAEWLTVLVA